MSTDAVLFESKFSVENKNVFVDVKTNSFGTYLKISERNRSNKSVILLPAKAISSLIDALTKAAAVVEEEG